MKNQMGIVMLGIAILFLGACQEEPAAPAPAASVAPAAPAPAASAAPVPVTAPTVAAGTKPAAVRDRPTEALKRLTEAMGPVEGATHCERAYNGAKALMEKLAKPGDKAPPMPGKERFIKACSKLPETMQKCMTMSYAILNGEECKKAKDNLDPKLLKELQNMKAK